MAVTTIELLSPNRGEKTLGTFLRIDPTQPQGIIKLWINTQPVTPIRVGTLNVIKVNEVKFDFKFESTAAKFQKQISENL
mgnify:CR=1 FL=1